MNFFVSDLDNTIIYSYNHDIGCDKLLVETKNGKKISYMTKNSYQILQNINNSIPFIPLTTRSLKQYSRIDFGFIPRYAIVSNGGILLIDGVEDKKWHKESIGIISSAMSELYKGMEILKGDKHTIFEVRLVDELFVFTKSDDTIYSMNLLKEQLDTSLCDIKNIGKKVYIIPKMLDKGLAVKRMRTYLCADTIICSGDSEFDIPMLKEADFSLMPQNLYGEYPNARYFNPTEKYPVFSDWILSKIQNMV